MDDKRALLRHTVATVAYRGGKAVRGAPASFAAFSGDQSDRTAVRILAHIGDLFDWALSQAKGAEAWHDSAPLGWDSEVDRFHAALQRFDDYLASDAPIQYEPGAMFQGGLADALTHTGQLAMLRRLGGYKMKGESYAKADIEVGRVGIDQVPANPKYEFD